MAEGWRTALAAGDVPDVALAPRGLAWTQEHRRDLRLALTPDHPVGAALASRSGPEASAGPDYVRVTYPGTPNLSLVLDDALRLVEVAATHCVRCTEPERWVEDLLADVTERGNQAHRLLPGVELFVDPELSRLGESWVGALQVRNHEAGQLEALLAEAEVVGSDEQAVRVRYRSGVEDVWTVRWSDRGWQLDYGALPEDSPLRMSRSGGQRWRSANAVRSAALEAWRPRRLEQGPGVRLGHSVVGGGFDPRDGTVLLVLLELDRSLSALVRIEPDTGEVLARIPLPSIGRSTNLPTEGWYARWPVTLSPDASRIAVSLPGRVRVFDVQTGRSLEHVRTAEVTAVGLSGDALAYGDAWGRIRAPGIWARLPAAPVLLTPEGKDWLAVDAEGGVWRIGAGTEPERLAVSCCGRAVDAAVSGHADEVLVGCGAECGVAAHRVSLVGDPTVGLGERPSGRAGVATGPMGRWRCSGAPLGSAGPVTLWDEGVRRGSLGADAAVKQVLFEPSGERLLTIDVAGEAWLWDLARVRQAGS